MKYKHAENIIYAPREDGSIVLTDIEDSEGQFFKLNEVSKDIWLLIEDELSHEEIHEKMASIYEPYNDESKKMVDDFIKELIERSFILQV